MSGPSKKQLSRDELREKLIGLGEGSIRKSYFPELQRRLAQLERDQELLTQSEQRYRSVMESVPVGIFIAETPSCRFLFLNRKICEIFGYTEEEGLRLSIWDVADANDHDRIRSRLQVRMVGRPLRPNTLVVHARRKDGSFFRAEVTSSLVTYQGRPALQGIIRDVTEQELLERQLRHSQKMEAANTLASGIAHDFNNILQVISGYTQLLAVRIVDDPESLKYLSQMTQAVEKAAALVQGLLTFSRKVAPTRIPLNINNEINQMSEILNRTIPKMIQIETRLADDLSWISGDSGQLTQVIMNLAANARDAMPEGGRLTIRTENMHLTPEHVVAQSELSPGHYIRMTVEDTGRGMDADTVKRAFEPFFTTKDVGQGTGLGLSTVYGIVKAHDGHVTCDSEEGRGTMFSVYLPAVSAADIEPPAPAEAGLEFPGGDERILLVEDEPLILDVARQALEAKGYQIVTAGSGEEGIEVYRSNRGRIDLVILDLGMPGMGGRACLKELLKLNPAASIIVASGYSDQGEAAEHSGAAAFIGKPYRLADLLQTVRRVLDHPVG